ncbi:MAG: hypothetical protein NTY12_03765 [Candidatus Falkowbacteria bacterium]|nr:hypothetical protein [Candidatus Falkowbacteria bacterium]
MKEIIISLNNENKEFSDIEKLKKSNEYWDSKLNNEERISSPQNQDCEFSIVVPVYNEDNERLEKQIDSFRKQSIDSTKYEILYVVNNDLISEDLGDELIRAKNLETINMLRSIEDLPVYVIDKSSKGHEIEDCNVGKARNRGVAEASKRFYENNKNGILIQTDADTHFDDPDYLIKVQNIFKESPDVIGIAGGLVYEVDLDLKDPDKKLEQQEKINRFLMLKKWELFNRSLKKGKIESGLLKTTFSGANMISKSFETAVIGGLIDASSGEDPRFGKDLSDYANNNHKKVIGMKEELKVVTSLRDSDRTPASFKKVFDQIDLSKPLEVKGQVITPELLKEYENKIIEMENGKELIDNIEKLINGIRFSRS